MLQVEDAPGVVVGDAIGRTDRGMGRVKMGSGVIGLAREIVELAGRVKGVREGFSFTADSLY